MKNLAKEYLRKMHETIYATGQKHPPAEIVRVVEFVGVTIRCELKCKRTCLLSRQGWSEFKEPKKHWPTQS